MNVDKYYRIFEMFKASIRPTELGSYISALILMTIYDKDVSYVAIPDFIRYMMKHIRDKEDIIKDVVDSILKGELS